MRLGKALATGVAEERPRATDDELLLGEQIDETEKVAKSESASEEVPVAR
ncbi:hypothetical protein ACFU9Y_23735 [Streptomyces sp. NPDC057621]|uniref:Uncharacterized protein n=1 Tax=Streptomyces liliiviolaceus TaxID=2823109 RepID=A0A940XU23_9ACTN|nr:hypothetical protein [Streptomyces liliiviolaceus]MBQ0849920.1 hypothetical protein [Streptomyces liliiviolaceus]